MEFYTLREYARLLSDAGLLKDAGISGCENTSVRYLTYNSREVSEGTLFICKGAAFKPAYLEEAIRRGAVAYVSETAYECAGRVPALLVSDIRKAMPPLAVKYTNHAWEKLKITAFGGTKGKSTSASYMKAIVDDYMASCGGKESAILSSIDNYDGVIREESHITTPEAVELHQHMLNAVNSGITYLEMETSSQALKYDRLLDLKLDVAVFLNISEDHISPIEHKDFEDYFCSKMKMFDLARKAVVNLDADLADRVLSYAKKAEVCLTFSQKDPSADFYADQVRREGDETVFQVHGASFDEEFRLTMPGLFNVENALAAIAAACLQGIPLPFIRSGLYRARSAGRMEMFCSRDKVVTAIVDYAHNKLSFEKLFGSTKEAYPECDIVAVFGCPGGKALKRREDMGKIAGHYCTKVYLTADDPGPEDPQAISEEIASFLKAQDCPYEIIEDRGTAIHKAILECRRPTVLLAAGKGCETHQKYGSVFGFYKGDAAYVQQFLKEYDEAPFHAGEKKPEQK